MTINPLLQTLRDATDAQHQALHTHPLLAPLSNAITLANYYRIIQAFQCAYLHMNHAIRYVCNTTPSAPVLEWLEKDMAHHQINPVVLKLAPLTPIATRSALLGHLYVKQGSTLGGQIITKHLAKHLNLQSGISNHFFAGYGPDTGNQWRAFITALSETQVDSEEVTHHAIASFQCVANSCDAFQAVAA